MLPWPACREAVLLSALRYQEWRGSDSRASPFRAVLFFRSVCGRRVQREPSPAATSQSNSQWVQTSLRVPASEQNASLVRDDFLAAMVRVAGRQQGPSCVLQVARYVPITSWDSA